VLSGRFVCPVTTGRSGFSIVVVIVGVSGKHNPGVEIAATHREIRAKVRVFLFQIVIVVQSYPPRLVRWRAYRICCPKRSIICLSRPQRFKRSVSLSVRSDWTLTRRACVSISRWLAAITAFIKWR
jgi:hypothetical protein